MRPEFLKAGQLVMVDGWPGRIDDVAETDNGAIMVLVSSPKGVWRNHRPEWLPYLDGRFVPVEFEDVRPLFDVYVERVEMMARHMDNMRKAWEMGT
jgi:hypothetical protein